MPNKKDPNDSYTYANGTLKNKLKIHDYNELNIAEKNITFTKFLNIQDFYTRNFDSKNFRNIHKHIFEDIFSWAGEYRTVPIHKEEELIIPRASLEYAPVEEIPERVDKVLEKMNKTPWKKLNLDEKSVAFAEQLTELWLVHPFRDGNTRTTMTFATQFAKEHNFPLDLETFLPLLSRKRDNNGKALTYSLRDYFLLAALPKEFNPEPEFLQNVLKQSMISGINKNITSLQHTLNNTSKKDTVEKEDFER